MKELEERIIAQARVYPDHIIRMDSFLDHQLDIGLLDTMKDLFVNFIGAVVFSVIGYFYVKGRGKGTFASRFIPRPLPADQDDRQQ